MNKFLNEQNVPIIVLLVILIIITMCTRNPVSKFIWTLLNNYKIYNTTSTALTLCYKNNSGLNYTYLNLPANSNVGISGSTITNNILILTGGLPASNSSTTAPTAANAPAGDRVYSVGYFTGITLTDTLESQPVINLYDIATQADATVNTTLSSVVSGFAGSSLYVNNVIGKCAVILPVFKVIDYSTNTDTEDSVGGSKFNTATITGTGAGSVSRYLLNNGNTNILPGLTGSNLNNSSNVYSVRTSPASGAFTTTYYLPPYITSPTPSSSSALKTYILNYTNTTSGAFSDLTTTTDKSFFYGASGATGLFNLQNKTYSLVGTSSGDPGTITVSITSPNYNNITAPTNYEIRYLDTFNNITGSAKEITYYPLIKNGASYTLSGNGTATSLAANNGVYYPSTMPYVMLVPPSLLLGSGNSPNTGEYTNDTTGKYIFRSFNTTTNVEYKATGNTSTITPGVILRTTA